MSSGLLCRVVYYKFTGVSEVLAASIIRAIALPSTRLHGTTTQKTVILIGDRTIEL
jgi:hypothetical protein